MSEYELKRKPLLKPTVRTLPGGGNFIQVPGQPLDIVPILHANGRTGCMVVDVFFDSSGTARLRAALYVGLNERGTYTPMEVDSSWLVDLPDGYDTSKTEIRDAIVIFLKTGTKPPGPPEW